MIKGAGITDVGKNREQNEDDFLVLEPESLFIVCDGVGGQEDGEKASRMATDAMRRAVEANPPAGDLSDEDLFTYFSGHLDAINQKVYEASTPEAHRDNAAMATTMVLAYVTAKSCYIINVGDSRAYLIREGGILQLTRDHTYVGELVANGTITKEQAVNHPKRHMITRALGAEKSVQPDYFRFETKPGDLILLCSDGLYNEVPGEAILRLAKAYPEPFRLSRLLVGVANEEGGDDNITAVCVKVTEQ